MPLELLLSPQMLWLELGVALILAELYLGGIGIFFIGLGAITTGFFIIWHIITENNIIDQFSVFFVTSIIWTAILWKAFKNLKLQKKQFSNIIGDEAIVESNQLTKNKMGQVRWSGTTVKAKLAEHSQQDSINKGNTVIIIETNQNIFIVEPKN